jgi:hypothetical protein
MTRAIAGATFAPSLLSCLRRARPRALRPFPAGAKAMPLGVAASSTQWTIVSHGQPTFARVDTTS